MPHSPYSHEPDCPGALDPVVRPIYFEDDPDIVNVSTQLRKAWTALPTTTGLITQETLVNFIRTNMQANAPKPDQNPDTDDINSPWRQTIAYMWNHVYTDLMRGLEQASMTAGHHHLPSHGILPLYFPQLADGGGDPGTEFLSAGHKIWDTNVLIAPTFLAPGVKLRVTRNTVRDSYLGKAGTEVPVVLFDREKSAELWYLRRNYPFNFYIECEEGEGERERKGVAAVIAVGILCTEWH